MSTYRSKGVERIKPEKYLYRWDVALRNMVYCCNCNRYLIHSFTKCGVWIYMSQYATYQSKLKFVNMQSKKKYACETKEEALISFKARKNRQIRILNRQIETAKVGLEMAINGENFRNVRQGIFI